MTLTLLREHTRIAHQSLEKLLIPRIKNIRRQEDYAQVLALFYGYFHPLEERIAKFVNSNIVLDWQSRRKSAAILTDFKHVNSDTTDIPLCNHLPDISNEVQALGALYVMEGSTLGGKIITQMVMKNLDVTPQTGISFFYGYGDATESMWTTFTSLLNNYPDDGASRQQMAAAAEETFTKFGNWILEN